VKILVVDDHPLVRDILATTLAELDPMVIVLEAVDAQSAQKICAADTAIDLVLLDPGLPDCRDLDLLARLRASHPALPIVVFSGTEDRATVDRAIQMGALGFIPKSSSRNVLILAIRMVLAGAQYLPPVMAGPATTASPDPSSASERSARIAAFKFTPRERQVLALRLRYALQTKEIAEVLAARDGKSVTNSVIRLHMSKICQKMKIIDSSAALVICFERGIRPEDLDPNVEAPEDLPREIRRRVMRRRP